MATKAKNHKVVLITIEKALLYAKNSMKNARVTAKARRQLIGYSTLYIIGVVAVASLVSFGIAKLLGLVIETSFFWLFLPPLLLLMATWAGVTFLYYGYIIVEPNEVWFVGVLGGVLKPISQGRTDFFPPIQSIHPQYISLQLQNVTVEEEIELREFPPKDQEAQEKKEGTVIDPILGRRIKPHEETTVIAKLQVEYQIFNAYRFVFVMGGNTKEEKQKIISGLVQDPLQTFINDRGYGEDELVALLGYKIWTGHKGTCKHKGKCKCTDKDVPGIKDYKAVASGERLEEAVKRYGFQILRVTIHETELDELRKAARVLTYQARKKGEARNFEVQETVKSIFSTPLKDMDEAQLREVRAFYVTLKATEAMDGSSKYLIGATAIIDEIGAMLGRKF